MQPQVSYDLDLILPCYNPPEGWDSAVCEFLSQLKRLLPNSAIRLIIVSDGSRLNFDEVHLTRLRNQILDFIPVAYETNRGKGYALREAVKVSSAPYTIYTDYDFPFGVDAIATIFKLLQSGNDVVASIRDKSYFQKLPTSRRLISLVTKAMNRHILRLTLFDTQAGLKGFNAKGKDIFLATTINSFLFDTEFILKAERNKDISMAHTEVAPRAGIEFSNMGFDTLKAELINFIQLARK